MAMKDDDDEECIVNSAGVARYQCMPSEVALQQMRNRLQCAKLGKKLMKWTALASSREMRTLGSELEAAYDELNEQLQDAYIMLARSRYFNANLNNIVTENVEKNAAVLVDSHLKARSGVKVMQQEIKVTNHDPYIYLGIEKGGEIIMEAKKKWLEIIRMLILIMQLRATFLTVEKANKAANKKKNVFTRIIIPRTIETIAYIESGLEELAREDFFRLRRFIYKKRSATPSYQERKPMEIKERLIPKASKRLYKIECFMCGAFLRFSLVNEREKFLERRKVEELRFQMNEMLQIAKKLEEKGIVDINVDEFIVTAEKLKEKLNESPHIDQLCRTCKELLKRKHEEENQNQELQNVKTESIALQAELLAPTKEKTDKDETKMLETPTQNLNIEQIDKNSKFIKRKRTDEPEHNNKITENFTEIHGESEEDFTKLKERSVELPKKEISTITITKELKSELSMNSQTLLDLPLETSIEKIKKVVTDEKENKSFVEEKFIITIKEKIKNVIGKISKLSQNVKNSIDENNNQDTHEITTVIKIDSRLSSEPISSESRDLMSNFGLTIKDKKSKAPTRISPSTASNNQIVKVGTPPPSLISSEGALEQKAPQFKDYKNNSQFSYKPKTIKTIKKELKGESSKKLTPPCSTSFTDIIIPDTIIEDEFKNEAIKISTSMPSLYHSIDEPQEKVAQTNDMIDSSHLSTEANSSEINLISTMPYASVTIKEEVTTESRAESTQLKISVDQTPRKALTEDNVEHNSRTSTDSKSPKNEEIINTTNAIQIKGKESNKISISKENSKDKTPQKRVQNNDIKRSNSLPTVSRTSGVTPLGSISHAGISGVYIPPQNPIEILSEPCLCISSTTLLSTELDTNRE